MQDYRDLYLDRSRARYELDLQTDLGDAMVRFSDARLQAARVKYQLELAWEQLDAITGRSPEQSTTAGGEPATPANPQRDEETAQP